MRLILALILADLTGMTVFKLDVAVMNPEAGSMSGSVWTPET